MFQYCALVPVTILSLLWIFRTQIKRYHFSTKLVGPKGLLFIGNGFELINKSPQKFIKILQKYFKNYGKLVRIWIGPQLVILMTDPKDVEVILTDKKLITKSDEYNYLVPWLNTGLLTSTGKKWISRRKILTPAFHFKILEDFVEIFDKESKILIEKLKKFENKDAVNIFPLLALCSLDAICETAMGISLNSQDGVESEYVNNVNEIANIIHRRSFDFIQRFDLFYQFTPTYRRQQNLIKALHGFTDKVIIARREKLLSKTAENMVDHDFVTEGRRKLALLDLLLQSQVDGKYLTNEDIREEIDTFMFEGHDTTSSGIAFALYNIAKYQEVQQNCFEEIKKVFGNEKEKAATMQDLNNLKYLELVCKESLRLYPSVPLIGRKVIEDLNLGGRIIPKGASIVIGLYFMGRDPDIWEEPEKFIPERFDIETTSVKVNPFSYTPFSAGSRNCIGQKFAMYEMTSIISTLVRHYELSLEHGFEPKESLDLVIKSNNGIMLKLSSRNY